MIEAWTLIRSALPGIWKNRHWALLTTLLLGALGAGVSVFTPGLYEATARAHVDTQSILKPLMEGMTVGPNVEQQVQMMARTLVSRPNLERVMKAVDLESPEQGRLNRERALDELAKRIILRPAGGTNFYSIEYRNTSQETALKVVDSLLAIFMESTRETQSRDTRQALEFVDQQIAMSKRRLEATENALKDFKIENINVMPNLAQDYVAGSADAQRELQQARLELRQAINSRAALQRRLASVPETYTAGDATDALSPRPLTETETRLQAAHARLDEYLTRFTDAHPDVLNTRRVISELDRQLKLERSGAAGADGRRSQAAVTPNRLHQELSVSLADLESRVAALSARVSEAEGRMAQMRELAKTIPAVEAKFIQLNRDYESNKNNYEQLLSRRASAQMAGNLERNSSAREFRIVDPPRVSSRPIWPNRPLLLILTFIGSLAAGIGVAFFLDRVSPVFFDGATLRDTLKLPTLGSVSFVANRQTRSRHKRSVVGYSAAAILYSTLFAAAVGFYLFGHLLHSPVLPGTATVEIPSTNSLQ